MESTLSNGIGQLYGERRLTQHLVGVQLMMHKVSTGVRRQPRRMFGVRRGRKTRRESGLRAVSARTGAGRLPVRPERARGKRTPAMAEQTIGQRLYQGQVRYGNVSDPAPSL